MRWLALPLLLLLGCQDELLIRRDQAWAADAQLVLLVLDEAGVPLLVPQLLRAEAKLEILLPPGPARELVIYEYAPEVTGGDGTPLVDCGVSLDVTKAPFPAPRRQFRTGLFTASSADDLAFVESSGELLPLYQERCSVPACEGMKVTQGLLPELTSVQAVAPAGPGEAWIFGTRGMDTETEVAVVPLKDGLPQPFALAERQIGAPLWAAFDQQDGFYVLASLSTRRDALLTLARDGTTRQLPLPALGLSRRNVAATPSGEVYVGGGNGLFEFTQGATVARRLDELVYGVDALQAVRKDRIFVADPTPAIHYFDGQQWTTEWFGGPSLRIHGIAADAERAVAVGTFGLVLLRDEQTHRWEVQPPPPTAVMDILRAVALLAGDRYVASFNEGGLGIWNQGAWCSTMTPPGVADVFDLTTLAGGRQAAAAARFEGQGAGVWIIEAEAP